MRTIVHADLGRKVTWEWRLRRESMEKGFLTWTPRKMDTAHTGVLVGLRTLQSGKIVPVTEYGEVSGGTFSYNEWKRTGSVPAALVVETLHHRPYPVPADCLTFVKAGLNPPPDLPYPPNESALCQWCGRRMGVENHSDECRYDNLCREVDRIRAFLTNRLFDLEMPR